MSSAGDLAGQVAATVDLAVERFGRIDILVNTAGGPDRGSAAGRRIEMEIHVEEPGVRGLWTAGSACDRFACHRGDKRTRGTRLLWHSHTDHPHDPPLIRASGHKTPRLEASLDDAELVPG
jgi:hypothetical protein